MAPSVPSIEVYNVILMKTSETIEKYFPAKSNSASFLAKFSDW